MKKKKTENEKKVDDVIRFILNILFMYKKLTTIRIVIDIAYICKGKGIK